MSRSTTEAINSYLTDMLALEEHILVAITAQVKDFNDGPQVLVMALDAIQVTVEHHVTSLKEIIQERDAGAANSIAEAVKRAASVLAGAGAAAVDLVRNEKLPKDLRDDYTAFSLATVSYVMLLTHGNVTERPACGGAGGASPEAVYEGRDEAEQHPAVGGDRGAAGRGAAGAGRAAAGDRADAQGSVERSVQRSAGGG